jgi:hypothetical protein
VIHCIAQQDKLKDGTVNGDEKAGAREKPMTDALARDMLMWLSLKVQVLGENHLNRSASSANSRRTATGSRGDIKSAAELLFRGGVDACFESFHSNHPEAFPSRETFVDEMRHVRSTKQYLYKVYSSSMCVYMGSSTTNSSYCRYQHQQASRAMDTYEGELGNAWREANLDHPGVCGFIEFVVLGAEAFSANTQVQYTRS